MRLPFAEALATVLLIAGLTYGLRLLPFTIFRNPDSLPKSIVYIGQVLPFSVITMLIVFCFRDVLWDYRQLLLRLLACIMVVILQVKWHNMLLSIGGGTVVYMILIRIVSESINF